MGADFELLARLLVDMRRAQHGEFLDPGRQRDRAAHPSAGAAGGLNDLARRLVEHAMIVSPQADTYVLAVHQSFPASLGSASHMASATLFNDLGDDARADGAATLANRNTQPLLHPHPHQPPHLH